MHSYEDRIRAVKLYEKFGKRTGATIRQVGYPTKNSFNLQDAWRDIVKRAKLVQHHIVTREELSMREHISIVLR